MIGLESAPGSKCRDHVRGAVKRLRFEIKECKDCPEEADMESVQEYTLWDLAETLVERFNHEVGLERSSKGEGFVEPTDFGPGHSPLFY